MVQTSPEEAYRKVRVRMRSIAGRVMQLSSCCPCTALPSATLTFPRAAFIACHRQNIGCLCARCTRDRIFCLDTAEHCAHARAPPTLVSLPFGHASLSSQYDELTSKHIDQLRQLTKQIQDARIARDNDAIKTSLEVGWRCLRHERRMYSRTPESVSDDDAFSIARGMLRHTML